MSNYWVRVENNTVVECLGYDPQREGDWRQAINISPVINSNRQITDGHWFDLSKTPVEIQWNIKDISVEDRRQQILNNCISPLLQEIQEEIEKEQNCSNCDPHSGCCTRTIADKLNVIKGKRAEILALSTHEEIDEYAAANPPA
jgi:hypothetical protein